MTGIIYRISGPVVTVEGLENAKMYDVVRVGTQSLIGEIIKLDNGRAIVQVYEDTTGLRPGEPVVNTNVQLSVVLGPGLMGSIYDGIQRPLDKIQKLSGDFIARGINVDALDTKKKWEFNPKVKKGDKVKEGDIIGEVDETSLIKHRVMVPIGIEGTVEDIKHSSFTVLDTIAIIKTKNGDKEVKLAQRWPVRIARPVRSKLPPEIPLITGQRIIDTLFPVAKGGTAAVPGPFGSGKCVDKSTLVMLGNGRILSMTDIYDEGREKGKFVDANGFEELYDVSGLGNPSVITLDKQKFSVKEPKHVYRGKTDSTIKITTKTGKMVEVTPVHRLFALKDCGIVEKEAQNLKVGDYIVAPRKVKLELEDQKLDLLALLNDAGLFSADNRLNDKIRVVLRGMLFDDKVPRAWEQYLRTHRKIPLKIAHTVLNSKLDKPHLICSYHGKIIKLPVQVTPKLAEYLGYVIGDGNLKKSSYSVRFYNSSKKIMDRYLYLTKVLFGITPYVYEHPHGNSRIAQVDCKTLFDFLVVLGVPYKQKARNARIPEHVLKSSDKSNAAFIGAYISCDGSVSTKTARIEIVSRSRRIIEEFSFVLLRLGIISSIGKTRKDGTSRITIKIDKNVLSSGIKERVYGNKRIKLSLIANDRNMRYSNNDSVPVPHELVGLLKEKGVLGHLVRNGIHASRYVYGNEHLGIGMLNKIISALGGFIKISRRLISFRNMLEVMFFDRISSLEIINSPKDVFDLEVPNNHNFVGGHGPLLLHNTVIQQQLAKWSDADIIVYTACGERGNEATEVLTQFPKLHDPKSGKPLMDRTILIANTSNMPVAAREASIYTGITLAEYYRDMGYSVALMADSTSRWAEALREISGRLEEMPGEEGYPAYLGRKVAEFYERAGRVTVLNGATASITAIGAVSPPGGDTSEPVSQATLRVTRVFWALDASLANRRHFPSINWLNSYSLYIDELKDWYAKNAGAEWNDIYSTTMELLQKEAEINEIVQLVGYDALPEKEKMVLDMAKVIREDYLQQSAFDEVDTFTSIYKQNLMLKSIIALYNAEKAAVERGVLVDQLQGIPAKLQIARMKFTKEEQIDAYYKELQSAIEGIGDLKAQSK
jgi:V/A-type H+-transporting ATPase subunit A